MRFFGPPAPPASGPSLGPRGPLSNLQQQRPQQHPYSLAFPPRSSQSHVGSLQRAFDPLGLFAELATPATSSSASSAVSAQALAASALVLTCAVAGLGPVPTTGLGVPQMLNPSSPLSSTSAARSKPLITYQRRRARPAVRTPLVTAARRGRPRRAPRVLDSPAAAGNAVRRTSARLVAKASGAFVDMTSQAVQRKALVNSLNGCSVKLKKHVTSRNILSRNQMPIGTADLRKLVSAAMLGDNNIHQMADVVPTHDE